MRSTVSLPSLPLNLNGGVREKSICEPIRPLDLARPELRVTLTVPSAAKRPGGRLHCH